jgi:hypothetical protein
MRFVVRTGAFHTVLRDRGIVQSWISEWRAFPQCQPRCAKKLNPFEPDAMLRNAVGSCGRCPFALHRTPLSARKQLLVPSNVPVLSPRQKSCFFFMISRSGPAPLNSPALRPLIPNPFLLKRANDAASNALLAEMKSRRVSPSPVGGSAGGNRPTACPISSNAVSRDYTSDNRTSVPRINSSRPAQSDPVVSGTF